MGVSLVNQFCSLFPSLSSRFTLVAASAGKKRAWVPDEKEAYIEIEIRERSGDKVVVETKDGKVWNENIAETRREKVSHFRLPKD